MHFRISAIQDEGTPDAMNKARLWLEDRINDALVGADFGCSNLNLMIVMFATASLHKAPAISRLTTDMSGARVLALHINIDPELIQCTGAEGQLSLLANHIVRGLPSKPLRKPKTLDYARLHQALLGTIRPLAKSAA